MTDSQIVSENPQFDSGDDIFYLHFTITPV